MPHAAVVLGCEAAIQTVEDALASTDCRVVQGIETEGIMNVLPRFRWPANIWLGCEGVTHAAPEDNVRA